MNDDSLTIKRITDFWITSAFLKKYKKLGEEYEKQIKKENELSKEVEK